MSNDWLVTHSYQQMQQMLTAINVISLRKKLTLLNAEDLVELNDYQEALSMIVQFVENLTKLRDEVMERGGAVIIGTNPRLRQFATHLFEHDEPLVSDTATHISFDRLPQLLLDNGEERLPEAIAQLDKFRRFVEQHVYQDAQQMLDEG